MRLTPTPVVRLNQAVAVGMAHGPQAGLDLTADPALRNYHLLPGVRADLLLRLGRRGEARGEFLRAAQLADNAAERAFLERRADRIPPGDHAGVLLGEAVGEFLAGLTPSTARSYVQALDRLCMALGARTPLATVTAAEVGRAVTTAWSATAARTWNRHLAAIGSFSAWAQQPGLTGDLRRREQPPPVRRQALQGEPPWEPPWDRPEVALRERVLWCLLHESAAPVSRVLALDVDDLDLDDRRSRTGVSWRSRTARLLPDLVAGRTRGPLFLSDRRPAPARRPAEKDLCPDTGRRPSYERAERLFKQATGRTLRDLRSDGVEVGAGRG